MPQAIVIFIFICFPIPNYRLFCPWIIYYENLSCLAGHESPSENEKKQKNRMKGKYECKQWRVVTRFCVRQIIKSLEYPLNDEIMKRGKQSQKSTPPHFNKETCVCRPSRLDISFILTLTVCSFFSLFLMLILDWKYIFIDILHFHILFTTVVQHSNYCDYKLCCHHTSTPVYMFKIKIIGEKVIHTMQVC